MSQTDEVTDHRRASDSGMVISHVSQLSDHNSRIESLESSDSKQWDAINTVQQRLPTWATMYISGISLLLGTAVGALYFVLNYMLPLLREAIQRITG